MAKKIITKKQQIILLLLYIFRFVNSKQIQEFLRHKDHRRVNSWLKDLTEKAYIERDFKTVFGTLTKPAVYSLSTKGRAYIKQNYQYSFPLYLRRISRDSKASKAFRVKCQIVADWYLTLFKNTSGKGTGIEIVDAVLNQLNIDTEEEIIPFNTRQCFTPAYFPNFILLEKIKPDVYMRKKIKTGVMHGLFFVIDAYIPRFLLRYTIKHMFDTLDEEYWEDENIHSLHIYFLCPNNKLIIYIKRLLTQPMQGYYAKTPLTIHFATRNELYKKKTGKVEEMRWTTVSSTDEKF